VLLVQLLVLLVLLKTSSPAHVLWDYDVPVKGTKIWSTMSTVRRLMGSSGGNVSGQKKTGLQNLISGRRLSINGAKGFHIHGVCRKHCVGSTCPTSTLATKSACRVTPVGVIAVHCWAYSRTHPRFGPLDECANVAGHETVRLPGETMPHIQNETAPSVLLQPT
jgi:hypothetical protein